MVIDELIEPLKTSDIQAYFHSSIPSDLDERISDLVSAYLQLNIGQQHILRGKLNFTDADKLIAYVKRMAVLAVRERSAERIWHGLVALVIVDAQADYRDILMMLSLLYHSAKKLRANPQRLFKQALSIAAPGAAEYIKGYLHWPRSIKMMGYQEVVTDDGFDYGSFDYAWIDWIFNLIDRLWPRKR